MRCIIYENYTSFKFLFTIKRARNTNNKFFFFEKSFNFKTNDYRLNTSLRIIQ